jgi:predicted RNA-binding protein with TRAM domain
MCYGRLKLLKSACIIKAMCLCMKSPKKKAGNYEKRHGHGKNFKRIPVEVGDELEVNITDVSPSGNGLSKIQGYVIHVPNAKPRERVRIKINQVGDKTANGDIIS